MQNEKIYVTHYSPLSERKEKLNDYFSKTNLKVEWIENENIENDFYAPEEKEWYNKMQTAYPHDKTSFRPLLKTEISIAVKHYECFKRIAKSENEYAIIFEDDVIFKDSAMEKYADYLAETPSEWDVIFFGYGCFLTVPSKQEGKLSYKLDKPYTRCLDSYIIKKTACEKILKNLKPITLPIDFELTYSFMQNDLKVYWWEPPLTEQGSQNSTYESSIR